LAEILETKLTETNFSLRASREELEVVILGLQAKVAELASSNDEKAALLHEVHHRVNNNLQVIASLLRMQGEASSEPQVTEALRVSQNRVESMAMIHAQLYDTGDMSEVNFPAYLQRLADNLLISYGVDPARIALRVAVDPLHLAIEQAIPAGLILSELISNALKHAFPNGRRGAILIEGGRRPGLIELAVQDDGTGIAEEAPVRPKSLGLKIVTILTRQLKGTLEKTVGTSDPGPGAIFRISFPEKCT
jgi:two-component sensor histidine kinase